jgi:Tfp pilus assembly protein PilP
MPIAIVWAEEETISLKIKRDPFKPTAEIRKHNDGPSKKKERPEIKMKGIMKMGGGIMAVIEVNPAGEVSVRPEQQVALRNSHISFYVKEITKEGIRIVLPDGEEIFYEY